MKKKCPSKAQPESPVATVNQPQDAVIEANASRLNEALAFHQQGLLDQAEAIYKEILLSQPQHFDALQLLATIALQRNDSLVAVELFDQALKINPHHPSTLSNRGNALFDLKCYEQALESYDSAIAINPGFAEAFNNRGSVLLELKRPEQALDSFERALTIWPDFVEALNNRGSALLELKRPEQALDCFGRAFRIQPGYIDALYNSGKALRDLNCPGQALDCYDGLLAISPDYAEAHYSRENALRDLILQGQEVDGHPLKLAIKPDDVDGLNCPEAALVCPKWPEQALDAFNRALAANPDNAEVLNSRGMALFDLNCPEQALASYERALAVKPDYAEALNNRGLALRSLKRPGPAVDSYNYALSIKPDYPEALFNRGNALRDLNRHGQALDSYHSALAFKPDYAEALYSRGNAWLTLNCPEQALGSYKRALTIKPDYALLYGLWLHTKMKICDWSELTHQAAQLVKKIGENENCSPPFYVLALSSSLALQRKAAEIHVQAKYPVSHALGKIPKLPKCNKIHIGYFSADFRGNHPTSLLIAELFEKHDRSRFELTAFSFGSDAKDEMRRRLVAAFDRFIDIDNQPDKEVAILARHLGIDIAVDLGGHTTHARTGLFALGVAPVQVNYLGYPGTMGAEYIDYIIADDTVIPTADQQYFTEKVVYLPDSYQVNDAKRPIADKAFTKIESGLPQTGFVFCCFNNNFKITPRTFDSWMRILKQVEGSVLWLFEDNAAATNNLRKEAELRGVNPERLVFAQRMPLSEHLARHRLADLFLDTLPYNAHTTASDALWAGLPVLTCIGETFAGRVAASLLKAIHLPELITSTPETYEALAVELANNSGKLRDIKQKLAENRLTTPLFNAPLFTRHIEAAYTEMYRRYQADQAPEPIIVADLEA